MISLESYIGRKSCWQTPLLLPWFCILMSLDPGCTKYLYNLDCVSAFFVFMTKMPVFCIVYGCDNNKWSAPEKTSFYRLPLNKPSVLKQVRILFNIVHIYISNHLVSGWIIYCRTTLHYMIITLMSAVIILPSRILSPA